MIYALYNKNSGVLLDLSESIPNDVPEELALSVIEGELPDRYFFTWDKNTHSFVPRANVSRSISVLQFLNRFTAEERILIKSLAKTNDALADYFDMVNAAQFIDLDDPTTIGGVNFLATAGIILSNRPSEILG